MNASAVNKAEGRNRTNPPTPIAILTGPLFSPPINDETLSPDHEPLYEEVILIPMACSAGPTSKSSLIVFD